MKKVYSGVLAPLITEVLNSRDIAAVCIEQHGIEGYSGGCFNVLISDDSDFEAALKIVDEVCNGGVE